MPSKKHQDIVARLVQAGSSTTHFRKSVVWAILQHRGLDLASLTTASGEVRDVFRLTRFQETQPEFWSMHDDIYEECDMLPDAFRIDLSNPDEPTVVVQEAVLTSDVDPADYVGLWNFLDHHLWFLRLEVYSHHGGLAGSYGELEFTDLYHERIGNS